MGLTNSDCSSLSCPICSQPATLLLTGVMYYSAPLIYEADCSSCGEAVLVQARSIQDKTLEVRLNPFVPRSRGRRVRLEINTRNK